MRRHSAWSAAPIAYDPVEHRVAAGSSDGTVYVLDAATGEILMTGRGHGSRLTALTFASDGSRLFVAGSDGTVKVWSLSGQDLLTLRGTGEHLGDVAVSPDVRTVAASGPDGTILLWRTGP